MLLNMLNKFNPFKGSQCEDNPEESCTKAFEETRTEGESFTFISSNITSIPEIDYVVSMSEVVYSAARGFALRLPSSLKITSNLTSYVAKGAAITNHADVAWKANMISKGCDVVLYVIEACSPGISESCLHKIIEEAVRTQGISVYGNASKEYTEDEYELHEVTSREIDAAEDYANPNTKVQGASFVQSGPIHQRVAFP